ncbi:MAG: DUF234 domain-containing protein [Promicromonosporaceae bacterium]|nr:DUF234 domain-containing protein [Promicromonosporaceae bacterium]
MILPRDRQSIVVLDEVPYLMREDKRFEGMLQAVWDRVLNRLPVLLILIGSNRSEMERLTSYDRPFHLRGTEMELGPLSVSDVASFTGLGAADAIDAFAVTGGQPLILAQWESGMTLKDFIRESIADPLSALLVSGERVLTAEFPTDANANGVLRAIGAGEATFTSIANSVGMSETTLQRSLDLLADRRMIVVERPLATSASRNTRYRIEDPYLRFWLAFLADQIPTIEAGRSNLVIDAIKTRWLAWRGRAIEPIIRDLLWRSYGITPPAAAVGGWWNRSNSIEIDLIGADRAPVAHKISYVGSIKWRESHPFGSADLAALVTASEAVPGAANAPYLAVSRTGFDVAAANLTTISPDQLVGS